MLLVGRRGPVVAQAGQSVGQIVEQVARVSQLIEGIKAFGATVVFAIANLLERQGERAEFLALLELIKLGQIELERPSETQASMGQLLKPGQDDSTIDLQDVFDGVVATLQRLRHDGVSQLVVEDVHYLDSASGRLFSELGDAMTDDRALAATLPAFVFTARPQYDNPTFTAMRQGVIDMAVGIIIGAAFGKIVSSFVGDVIMPPIGICCYVVSGMSGIPLGTVFRSGLYYMPSYIVSIIILMASPYWTVLCLSDLVK